MRDPLDFAGRTVLITGGSRGLGKAMALAFAERGANLIISSRKLDSCEEVAQQCREVGTKAVAISLHAGKWKDADEFAGPAWEAFGGIDVLINNAGMSLLTASSVETTEEIFDKVVGVNFKGPFRLTALIGSRMVQHRGGSIINVSSTGSLSPRPEYAPYAGAKAALNAITQAFAFEFAPKVRVNAIVPGLFRTDISKAWSADRERNLSSAIKRFGEPEEIVSAALYLASPASSYTTGSLVRVDGGGG